MLHHRVELSRVDGVLLVQIHQYHIGVGAHLQRALLGEDTEQLGGIFTHDLHQLLHGDPALVDALGQHNGQRGLQTKRTVAGLPDVSPVFLFRFLLLIHLWHRERPYFAFLTYVQLVML